MTFRQTLHRHLQALERSDLHARLFATPLEIHEAANAGFAVLQRRDDKWVSVQDQDSLIK